MMQIKYMFSALFALSSFPVMGKDVTINKTSYIAPAFDVSVATLPHGFSGHNFNSIYKAVTSFKKKTEFESTNDYKQRLERSRDKKISNELNLGSLLAFSATTLTVEYDADQQIMKIKLEGERWSDSFVRFTLASKYNKQSNYIGANAFNRKMVIERGSQAVSVVQFSNCVREYEYKDNFGNYYKNYQSTESNDSFVLDLEMHADRAKQIKDSLALLFIGRLAPPFYDKATERNSPTIDSPFDVIINSHVLLLDVESIWLYDRASGTVYFKASKCSFLSGKDKQAISGRGYNYLF
jgi:hypothetical protein